MHLFELGLTWGVLQVPVIAVFTKFERFKHEVETMLEDEGRDRETDLDAEVERKFEHYYVESVRERVPFVRLESEV
jgi:hypothetical protein